MDAVIVGTLAGVAAGVVVAIASRLFDLRGAQVVLPQTPLPAPDIGSPRVAMTTRLSADSSVVMPEGSRTPFVILELPLADPGAWAVFADVQCELKTWGSDFFDPSGIDVVLDLGERKLPGRFQIIQLFADEGQAKSATATVSFNAIVTIGLNSAKARLLCGAAPTQSLRAFVNAGSSLSAIPLERYREFPPPVHV
jgi:hypothetical protein